MNTREIYEKDIKEQTQLVQDMIYELNNLYTSPYHKEEINQELRKEQQELERLKWELKELIDIDLDMNNISNLFTAWGLSSTAFQHVKDGDEISLFYGTLRIKTPIGDANLESNDQSRVQLHSFWERSPERVYDYALQVSRLGHILYDIQGYQIHSPEFFVKVNLGRS